MDGNSAQPTFPQTSSARRKCRLSRHCADLRRLSAVILTSDGDGLTLPFATFELTQHHFTPVVPLKQKATKKHTKMNYGQRAKELIADLKRSDWLPPYNDESVKAIQAEIQSHFEELNDFAKALYDSSKDDSDMDQQKKEHQPVMLLHEAAIYRNKRCLLAYHQYRIDKLKQLRWETSAVLPPHVRSLVSESEQEFYMDYDKFISRYNESLSSCVDLNSNLQPPEEDNVMIRVVKNGLGTIETESWGKVSLDMGTTHYLPRADVEHLIRQGYLEQLDGEENG